RSVSGSSTTTPEPITAPVRNSHASEARNDPPSTARIRPPKVHFTAPHDGATNDTPTVVGGGVHTPPVSPDIVSFAQSCTAPYPAKSSALIRCPARIATLPPHKVTTAGSASRTSVPAACGFTIPLTPRTTWNVCTSP